MTKPDKFWDRIAPSYEKSPIKDEQAFQHTIENIKRHLTQESIVLDFACGTGTISNQIAGSAKQIQAIDISAKMLGFAKTKAATLNIENIQHLQTTIFDDQLRPEQFDVVVAFNILHLAGDLSTVTQRIHELLKPGGLLITSTACLSRRFSLIGILDFILGRLRIVPNLHMTTFGELKAGIENSRFEIVEVEPPEKKSINYFMVAKKR